MAVITLQRLSKWYGEVIGLNDVSVDINRGITGLLGPNGAGKTTLMGLAIGQLKPSQGTIRVFGKRVWDNPRVLRRIGFCPEGDPFWYNLTGWQFVRLLARMSGMSGREARRKVAAAIERVGMSAHQARQIKGYSKGMRQRVKIAQALVHEPELLILDEPFTGADPVSRRDLATLFRDLATEGVDILISSHVLHEVEALTQQIVMINHGRIIAEGDLRAVRRQLHNRPHAIRIRLDQPRVLAAAIVDLPDVTSLQLPDAESLLIQTAAPDRVYDAIGRIVRDRQLVAWELGAADENLEAIFGYLTDKGL